MQRRLLGTAAISRPTVLPIAASAGNGSQCNSQSSATPIQVGSKRSEYSEAGFMLREKSVAGARYRDVCGGYSSTNTVRESGARSLQRRD